MLSREISNSTISTTTETIIESLISDHEWKEHFNIFIIMLVKCDIIIINCFLYW